MKRLWCIRLRTRWITLFTLLLFCCLIFFGCDNSNSTQQEETAGVTSADMTTSTISEAVDTTATLPVSVTSEPVHHKDNTAGELPGDQPENDVGKHPGSAETSSGVIPTENTVAATVETAEQTAFGGNVYPIEINKKYGFIDRTGKIIVQPIYDSCDTIWQDFLYDCDVEPGPLYYLVRRYTHNELGIPDSEAPSHIALIGPDAEVIYEKEHVILHNPHILKNGFISMYVNNDRTLLIDQDGNELISVQDNCYHYDDCTQFDRIVFWGSDGGFLLDLSAKRVTDTAFERFFGVADDLFIFAEQGGRVVLTDANGTIVRRLPNLLELHPLGNGYFRYRSADGSAYGYGLMDGQYNQITAPLYHYIYADGKKPRFFATPIDSSSYSTDIIGANGEILKDLNKYPHINENFKPSLATGDYSYYAELDSNRFGILNDMGEVLLEDTDEYRIESLYGDFMVMRTKGIIDYICGVKRVSDDVEGDAWILEPVYHDLYMVGRRYLYYARRDMRTYAILETGLLDLSNGQRILEQHLTSIEFADIGLFYVRTNREKGYMNEAGEWIFRTSVYDSLEIGD